MREPRWSRWRGARAALFVAVVSVVLSFLVSNVARADESAQSAAALFRDGEDAFAKGDYKRAAVLFEQADRIRPHTATLFNAARARERAGDGARAANLYARMVKEAPTSPEADEARASLTKLTKELGRLRLSLGKAVTRPRVDDVDVKAEIVFVDPGSHVVEAWGVGGGRGEEESLRRTVEVRAGEQKSVDLTVAAKADERSGWPPGIFYGLAGLTVVVGGVTAWSGYDTLRYHDDVFAAAATSANFDVGLKKQLRTNVLLGVTALFGILTGIAFFETNFEKSAFEF